jgi:hypothetical protein
MFQVLRRAALGFVVLHRLGKPPVDVLEANRVVVGVALIAVLPILKLSAYEAAVRRQRLIGI